MLLSILAAVAVAAGLVAARNLPALRVARIAAVAVPTVVRYRLLLLRGDAATQAEGFANYLIDKSPLFGGYKGTIK